MRAGKVKVWVEAMRLRTLPVSVAGVVLAMGLACHDGRFDMIPASLCLVFAILAQVASNFANEYYDYAAGLDRPGREGPRRGVTEGDISPRAMLRATYAVLAVACCVGCSLICFSGWWLVPVGIFVALGVIAYSAGPYPLSRHGLGEVAVLLFFGIVPVNCTYYMQAGEWACDVFMASISAGLMGANVLIVNNYRDCDADASVGKHTLAVKLGRNAMIWLYAANALAAVALMWGVWSESSHWWLMAPVCYGVMSLMVAIRMKKLRGRALTPLLGITSVLMLVYSMAFCIMSATE